MTHVHPVQPCEVDEKLREARPLLQRVAVRDERTALEDYEAEIRAGAWSLWLVYPGPQAVAVTNIVNYAQQKDFQILALAGDGMETWIPLLRVLEEFARQVGCDKAVVPHGRKGFAKVMKDYEQEYVVLEKRL